jgi:hypothetical protein
VNCRCGRSPGSGRQLSANQEREIQRLISNSTTANWIVAASQHETSRKLDPQLHTRGRGQS